MVFEMCAGRRKLAAGGLNPTEMNAGRSVALM